MMAFKSHLEYVIPVKNHIIWQLHFFKNTSKKNNNGMQGLKFQNG